MKIYKLFLNEKSNGFVVLKTCFSNHCVENCDCAEHVIFPFFCAKGAQTVRGLANLYVVQMIYLIFHLFEKEVDKILN
jgi:hypothetical protein